ncbi:MAG: hydantoinase/oxoprolinase family protein [Chloroflexota bacterium]
MVNTSFILAIDIGGTFTDIILLNQESGQLIVGKVLTSYPDPSQAVLTGVGDLLSNYKLSPQAIQRVIHGTTLVTNTLIERKGASTALITTRGFRDALEIGREGRYDIYDLSLVQPAPLVERRLRHEAVERVDAQGRIIHALDEAALRELCSQLQMEDIEAVAITFLHAYANPTHEQRTATIVQEMLPQVTISISHQVAPELREYERTSTTVANAYVQPLTKHYLEKLEEGLAAVDVNAPLHIMLSNAGTCSVETAAAFPIRLVESGPSGGALAAAYWGQRAGYTDVFAFDMGGTTAKAILSSHGEFPITTEAEVARVHRFKRGSGLPLLVPMLDMIEIGAGGGSIAHLNALKLPVVGPESASSTPGPACYGRGGTNPTVTDADLILGYLNPDYFVGGEMSLDVEKAQQAMEGLASKLTMDVDRMAWGVHQLVNETMAGAARVHAAERGFDIRKYTMVATGGAGPVHACGVAQRLGIKTVIIPPAAGVGSAFGMLLAPISFDFARSYVVRLDDLDMAYLNGLFRDLEEEGRQIVSAAGVADGDIQISRMVDMRYSGQGFEIRVPLPDDPIDEASKQIIEEAFEQEYTRIYGRLSEGVPIQGVNWRATVSGPRPTLQDVTTTRDNATSSDFQKGVRQALFDADAGVVTIPVYNRYALPATFKANGPAIVEEAESTTVVLPDWSISISVDGGLVLSQEL